MLNRRQMLTSAGSAALGLGAMAIGGSRLSALAAESIKLPFDNGERQLVKVPGKRLLIQQTARPPQLETPFSVFDESVITPNDAFFVRYHLADIPLKIDPDLFRLEVKGKVSKPLSLSLRELRNTFPAIEVVAVNQCSGNSRGFIEPRVAGGQLGNGAMGNARWRGVPLKAVLERAGVEAGAVQVAFAGLDGPASPDTPDFTKALTLDHARDGEVMLAYSMNGTDLPWLNGYPLRLIVPGYYGTYWVKHLNEITVLDKELDSFWMKTAYRIPDNECACVEPGKAPIATIPINVPDGAKVKTGKLALRGIAFDGGDGIAEVQVSGNGGQSWVKARLGKNLGKYSFREWKADVAVAAGEQKLMVKATNTKGKSQPMQPLWNPSGYMRNVVETTRVTAA